MDPGACVCVCVCVYAHAYMHVCDLYFDTTLIQEGLFHRV